MGDIGSSVEPLSLVADGNDVMLMNSDSVVERS